jgi:hypothetical protein
MFNVGTNRPEWQLDIFPREHSLAPKPLLLPPAGAAIDPAAVNLAAGRFALDWSGVVRAVKTDMAPNQYEVAVILSPGFEIAAGDADTPDQFDNEGETDTDSRQYRHFVFDEAGNGHWRLAEGDWVTGLGTDLRELLNAEHVETGPVDPEAWLYPIRPRPALSREVFTRYPGRDEEDEDEKPPRRPAELWVMTAEEGTDVSAPGLLDPDWFAEKLFDETIKIQMVREGGWELLDDRLGIRITAKNPNDWAIGDKATDELAPFPDGKVPLVECLAAPDAAANHPRVYFILNCVIEGDRNGFATSFGSSSSPAPFNVHRRVDSRDRFVKQVITKWSYHGDVSGQPIVERDDTLAARGQAHLITLLAEKPQFAGQATIRRVDLSYRLGDKIAGVLGRNASFRTDRPLPGVAPSYPIVVALDRSFAGEISTTLALDDLRSTYDPGALAAVANQEPDGGRDYE